MRKGKAVHRAALIQESDYPIIFSYQLVSRGIANSYRLASNRASLSKVKWIMATSLLKTLAATHKLSGSQVRDRYQAELLGDGKKSKGLQVRLPRPDKPPLVATWGAISLEWTIKATLEDTLPTF